MQNHPLSTLLLNEKIVLREKQQNLLTYVKNLNPKRSKIKDYVLYAIEDKENEKRIQEGNIYAWIRKAEEFAKEVENKDEAKLFSLWLDVVGIELDKKHMLEEFLSETSLTSKEALSYLVDVMEVNAGTWRRLSGEDMDLVFDGFWTVKKEQCSRKGYYVETDDTGLYSVVWRGETFTAAEDYLKDILGLIEENLDIWKNLPKPIKSGVIYAFVEI